jgi:uncharacterized membrane protein YeaQ/YmgE (transglycosylase-associated protein family)
MRGEIDMEVMSLVMAAVTGLVVGVLGWFLMPDGRTRVVWPAILVGVVAAVIGTAVARAVGVAQSSGVNWLELTFQLSFAASGVAGLAWATARRSSGRRSGRTA